MLYPYILSLTSFNQKMNRLAFILFFLVSFPIFSMGQDNFQEIINFSEKLISEGCPFEALIQLEKALSQPLSEDIREKILQTLFKAKFQTEDWAGIIHLSETEKVPEESLIIIARSYEKLGLLDSAIHYVEAALPSISGEASEDLKLELGFLLLLFNKIDSAKSTLKQLIQSSDHPRIYIEAIFTLSQIEMAQGNLTEAETLLSKVSKHIQNNSILSYRFSFLQGELAFHKEEWELAKTHFLKSTPSDYHLKAKMEPEIFFWMGWSNLNLSQNLALNPSHLEKYLKEAADFFEKAYQLAPTEKNFLASLECQVQKVLSLKLQNERSFLSLKIENPPLALSKSGKAKSLVLLLKLKEEKKEKEKILKKLIEKKDIPTSFQCEAHLYFAHYLIESADENLFDEGEAILKWVFDHTDDLELLFVAKKRQAEILLLKNTPLSLKESLKILKELQGQSQSKETKKEILYLLGMCGDRLKEIDQDSSYSSLIEDSWGKAASHDSKWGILSKKNLATYFFQEKRFLEGEDLFLSLSELSDPGIQPEALFYLALSIEKRTQSSDEARPIRKKLIDLYPDSSFAKEAYLHLFPFKDYFQKEEAISHLQMMPVKYPSSPISAYAPYLMGLKTVAEMKEEKDPEKKEESCLKAIDSFQQVEALLENKPKLEKTFMELFLRASLERALLNLELGDLSSGVKRKIYIEYAIDVLHHLKSHPFMQKILKEESYPTLLQEIEVEMALSLLKVEETLEAERLLFEMLENYSRAHIFRSRLLFRTLYTLGHISLKREDFLSALNLFQKAEEASKGVRLTDDQRLDLFIQEALSYQGLKEFSEMKLLLSKVINEDVASSQRLKAMFLRAEIYEKEGRKDLAFKQLYSLSKKGGEWGKKAKEKMEQYNE